MIASQKRATLIAYAVLLLVLFYGLIKIAGTGSGTFFALELLGLFCLLLLAMIAFIAFSTWGGMIFFLIFTLYALNLVLVWAVKGTLFVVLLLVALAGMTLALSVMRKSVSRSSSAETSPPREESVPSKIVKYAPGKYVASKNSNVYHEPKCEWAIKIEKERRVWFPDVREAIEKGYRKHSCVQ